MNVLPAINCPEKDFDCVKRKVKIAEGFASWLHLDIADGVFTFNKSWNEPRRWAEVGTNCSLEVHLMCEKPEESSSHWLAAGAKRLIVHIETLSFDSAKNLVETAGRSGATVMFAMNAETLLEELEPYLSLSSEIQVFSQSHPGPSGQMFLPLVLPKIYALRAKMPSATIEVDGGVDLEVARRAKEAGADTIVAGTYILGSDDPKKAYQELKEL